MSEITRLRTALAQRDAALREIQQAYCDDGTRNGIRRAMNRMVDIADSVLLPVPLS